MSYREIIEGNILTAFFTPEERGHNDRWRIITNKETLVTEFFGPSCAMTQHKLTLMEAAYLTGVEFGKSADKN